MLATVGLHIPDDEATTTIHTPQAVLQCSTVAEGRRSEISNLKDYGAQAGNLTTSIATQNNVALVPRREGQPDSGVKYSSSYRVLKLYSRWRENIILPKEVAVLLGMCQILIQVSRTP
jgi:hypothetical protein